MHTLGKALKNKLLGRSVVDNAANPASAYSMAKRKGIKRTMGAPAPKGMVGKPKPGMPHGSPSKY